VTAFEIIIHSFIVGVAVS